MEDTRGVFFDPETVAMLRDVLDDAWSRLPAGQTNVTRSLLAERILKAARNGERDPVRLRTGAIADGFEATL
jgi:hypothetical protein